MENSFRMSLFMPPISPIKDKATGRIVKNATLTPLRTVELSEVYKLVTANAKLAALTLAVRNAVQQGDDSVCRLLKQQTLPYVTVRSLHPTQKRLYRRDVRTRSSGRRPSRI